MIGGILFSIDCIRSFKLSLNINYLVTYLSVTGDLLFV
jgi:hypothetical protein